MDNTRLSDSFHDFFDDKIKAGLSEKNPLKLDVVEKKEMNETQQNSSEEISNHSGDENNSEENVNHDGEQNDTSDDTDDEEDKEIVNESSTEGIVIVQIDDGGKRLPRRSNSEVVIPCTPELSPETSLSGSTSYCSCATTSTDYTDSDSEPLEDDPTPIVIIKKVQPSSNVSMAVDDEAEVDDEDPGLDDRSLASSVVELRGSDAVKDGDEYNDDVSESEEDVSDVSESGSDTSTDYDNDSDDNDEDDDGDGNMDREMLYMHYRRANGQSVVEKVYLDISKFLEENVGLLKEFTTPEVMNGLRQSFSVTAEIEHLEETITEVTQRPNSAHCKMKTSIKDTSKLPAKEDNRTRADTPASQCSTDILTARTEVTNNDVSRPVTTGNNELKPDDIDGATDVQNGDLKTKHYKVLPAIGKGTTNDISTQQKTSKLPCSKPIPRTLNTSATVAPVQCTMRKPSIPHQLRSVACYQDGKVNVSIHGDQRLFVDNETPHLNITFVHRSEPVVKKQIKPLDEVGPRVEKVNKNSVKAQRGISNQQNVNTTRVQAKSATRKPPLPSITKTLSANKKKQNSRNLRQQTGQKNVQSAPKQKQRPNQTRATQFLPPLKRVPKSRQPQSKIGQQHGKTTRSCSDNNTPYCGIPMPRRITGINWNVVQTRAQWPPFNTHLNHEASERHHKMFTNIV